LGLANISGETTGSEDVFEGAGLFNDDFRHNGIFLLSNDYM
jgi:hypothetical protein